MTTPAELIERAARQMWNTWRSSLAAPDHHREVTWDQLREAAESGNDLIAEYYESGLAQAAAALRSLVPDDPHILDRLAMLASGDAWIAPNELSTEVSLAAMPVVAAWQANECAEISKGYDASKLDPEMAALDRGYRNGLLAYSGEEFCVIWSAMRSAALNQTDGTDR